MDHGLLRRLVGVALTCLVLLDITEAIEAVRVSQNRDRTKFIEVTTTVHPGSENSLSHLLLQPRRLDVVPDVRETKPLDSPRASGSAKTTGPNIRSKRWDFTMDGCHCDGYKIQCIHDSTCQHRRRSANWKCVHTCCGFQCVGYHTHQHNATLTTTTRNTTRYTAVQNSTSTTKASTRTIHSSLRNAFDSLHNALSSAFDSKNSSGIIHLAAQFVQGSDRTRTGQRSDVDNEVNEDDD